MRLRTAVLLTGEDCITLGPLLKDAIKYGWQVRGWALPPELVKLSDEVHRTARYHTSTQVNQGAGTAEPADGDESACSKTITAQEAANLGNISAGYIRRLLRQRDLKGHGGGRKPWQVDAASLQAWIADRNTTRRT